MLFTSIGHVRSSRFAFIDEYSQQLTRKKTQPRFSNLHILMTLLNHLHSAPVLSSSLFTYPFLEIRKKPHILT
ncbi:hypothetical protein, partial [Vibrio sp. M260118]|uniref:hypothetical protein n=1 Tax=Vibrio sp. M260118 TaxID=3020896 RepID=UPI002F41C2DD